MSQRGVGARDAPFRVLYYGKLMLDVRQFHAVCGGDGPAWVKECDFALLMTHHPSNCLRAKARDELRAEIAPPGRFVAHLSRRVPEHVGVVVAVGGAQVKRELQARSLLGLKSLGDDGVDRRNGYTAARITVDDKREATLRLWPRVATKLVAGHWQIVSDDAFELEDDHGTRPEPLPPPRRHDRGRKGREVDDLSTGLHEPGVQPRSESQDVGHGEATRHVQLEPERSMQIVGTAVDPTPARLGTYHRTLLAIAAVSVLLVAGIAFSFTPGRPTRRCFANQNNTPGIALAREACAAYLDTVRAFNDRYLPGYYAGFAEAMECFYDHADTSVRAWRTKLSGSLDVDVDNISFLRLEGDTRVVLCDLGIFDRGNGRGRKPHNKVIVMKKQDGHWKVAVEATRATTACYQSPC